MNDKVDGVITQGPVMRWRKVGESHQRAVIRKGGHRFDVKLFAPRRWGLSHNGDEIAVYATMAEAKAGAVVWLETDGAESDVSVAATVGPDRAGVAQRLPAGMVGPECRGGADGRHRAVGTVVDRYGRDLACPRCGRVFLGRSVNPATLAASNGNGNGDGTAGRADQLPLEFEVK